MCVSACVCVCVCVCVRRACMCVVRLSFVNRKWDVCVCVCCVVYFLAVKRWEQWCVWHVSLFTSVCVCVCARACEIRGVCVTCVCVCVCVCEWFSFYLLNTKLDKCVCGMCEGCVCVMCVCGCTCMCVCICVRACVCASATFQTQFPTVHFFLHHSIFCLSLLH